MKLSELVTKFNRLEEIQKRILEIELTEIPGGNASSVQKYINLHNHELTELNKELEILRNEEV